MSHFFIFSYKFCREEGCKPSIYGFFSLKKINALLSITLDSLYVETNNASGTFPSFDSNYKVIGILLL